MMRLLVVAIAVATVVHTSFAAPDVTSGPVVVSVDEAEPGPLLRVTLGKVELVTVSALITGPLFCLSHVTMLVNRHIHIPFF